MEEQLSKMNIELMLIKADIKAGDKSEAQLEKLRETRDRLVIASNKLKQELIYLAAKNKQDKKNKLKKVATNLALGGVVYMVKTYVVNKIF